MEHVIFACVHNAGRSQIGAAFLSQMADATRVQAASPGTQPGERVHPEVVNVMRYLAGRDEDRLADINDALRDPGIRAIFATTGGKGAYRMIVRPIPLRSTRSSTS